MNHGVKYVWPEGQQPQEVQAAKHSSSPLDYFGISDPHTEEKTLIFKLTMLGKHGRRQDAEKMDKRLEEIKLEGWQVVRKFFNLKSCIVTLRREVHPITCACRKCASRAKGK